MARALTDSSVGVVVENAPKENSLCIGLSASYKLYEMNNKESEFGGIACSV